MNNLMLTICFMLTIAAIGSVAAQSADEPKLKEAVESLRKAMVDADKAMLEKLTAKDLSYGHSSGKMDTQDSFINGLVSGESDFVNITLADQEIRITDKMALVRHKLSAHTNDKGKGPATVNIGVLLVWYKIGSDWKLVGRQAYKL
jgi:hypothetical protein